MFPKMSVWNGPCGVAQDVAGKGFILKKEQALMLCPDTLAQCEE